MQGLVRRVVVIVALAVMGGAGCHAPGIHPRPCRPRVDPRAATGVCVASTPQEAEFAVREARVEAAGHAEAAELIVLAELAHRIGGRHQGQPLVAAMWYRDAAVFAAFALGEACDPAQRARSIALHNHATEWLIRCAGGGVEDGNPAWRSQLAAWGVVLAVTTPARASLPINELWITRDYRVKNLERVERDGLGVPLIALSAFPNRESVPDRFYPLRFRLPATAVLRPGGSLRSGHWRHQPASLLLHDPAIETVAAIPNAACPLPLAADLTTPLAHQFLESPLDQIAWGGLLKPDAYDGMTGLLMGQPYQPGKIPVLFIHGLWSSPGTWLQMANALQADPVIRERYQIWYTYYPTGAPILLSAARLRQELHDLRQTIDPSHTDHALDQMVVVGHSMGGVIGRQMLLDSGRTLEGQLFTRPIETVAMSPQARSALSELLYFEREPSIARAIFIAAPHRGSGMAHQTIGRLASSLIQRPEALESLHEEIITRNGPAVCQPKYRERLPSSVDNLDWQSPVLQGLERLPMPPGVPYHSIIANLYPHAPQRFWSDGVVRYESAHLDGAESEMLFQYSHFAAEEPAAIAEVQRLLRLHVGVAGGDPNRSIAVRNTPLSR